MLKRIPDFYKFLQINEQDTKFGQHLSCKTGEASAGMTHTSDYTALSAIVLKYRPKRIFEIGTFLGMTSNFFLTLLPETHVVSIAYVNPSWNIFQPNFNNSDLKREQIGSHVTPENRSRFTQLYGNSHDLNPSEILTKYGPFDMIFVDGDHSAEGVALDTALSQKILTPQGTICWHDANPKPKYADVRAYLEQTLPLNAIATTDNFIGGVAAWNHDIETRLKSAA